MADMLRLLLWLEKGGRLQEGEGGSEHRLNDWKPWCANAVPGQGWRQQEGEGEGEHNLND